MKLHPHSPAELAVTAIASGSVAINQTQYAHSVTVHGSIGVQVWLVKTLSELSDTDLAGWIAAKPELVVLGSGTVHGFIQPKLAVKLAQAGIGIECMSTAAAVRTYNVLLDEGRDVLGAFII